MTRKIAAVKPVTALVSLLFLAAACGSPNGGGRGTSDTIASRLILGAPAEFPTRPDGLPGLSTNYRVTFGKFQVTDTGGPVGQSCGDGGPVAR